LICSESPVTRLQGFSDTQEEHIITTIRAINGVGPQIETPIDECYNTIEARTPYSTIKKVRR